MCGHRKVGLTIGGQVDLALASEEVEALALRLELGRELFGRDLGVRDMTNLWLLLVDVVAVH